MVTGTKFSDDLLNSELGLENYIIYRKTAPVKPVRKSMRGTSIAVHKRLNASVVLTNLKI